MHMQIKNLIPVAMLLALISVVAQVPDETRSAIEQVRTSTDYQPRAAFHHLNASIPQIAVDAQSRAAVAAILLRAAEAEDTTALGRSFLCRHLAFTAGEPEMAALRGWPADPDWAEAARIVLGGVEEEAYHIPAKNDLLRQISSDEPPIRIAALAGLAEYHSATASEPLKAALADSDHKVRGTAIVLKARLDGAGLVAALPYLDPDIQVLAFDALASEHAIAGAAPARTMIDDQRADVRAAARAALGRIGDAGDVELLADRGEYEAIGHLTATGVDAAILRGIESDVDIARRVTLILAAGERGTDDLISGLLQAARDSDQDVQSAALRVLSRQGHASVYPGLIAALGETGSAPIGRLISALGRRSSDATMRDDPLLAGLRNPDAIAEGRLELWRVLAGFDGSSITASARQDLDSEDPDLRDRAVRDLDRSLLPPRPEVRANEGAEKRVLIATGLEYPGHPWQKTTPILVEGISADPRLEVSVSEDPEILACESIAGYDAIVLHYQNHNVPPPEGALDNLSRAVKAGRGLVIVHFASGAFIDWETREVPRQFEELAGRVWNPERRGHDPHRTFRVRILDREHPITAGMQDFDTWDELYTMLDGDTPIHVLADARSVVDGEDYALVFIAEPGKGRTFHCALGHDERAFNQPALELFRRGTAWAAGLNPNIDE